MKTPQNPAPAQRRAVAGAECPISSEHVQPLDKFMPLIDTAVAAKIREIFMAGKFEVSLDKSKQYRYSLKSGDGKVIFKSAAYATLAECKSKISFFKKIVADAVIIDMEAEKKKALAKKEAEAKAKKAAVERAKKIAAAKKAAAAKKKSVHKETFLRIRPLSVVQAPAV